MLANSVAVPVAGVFDAVELLELDEGDVLGVPCAGVWVEVELVVPES